MKRSLKAIKSLPRVFCSLALVCLVVLPGIALAHPDVNWINMIDWIGLPSTTDPDSARLTTGVGGGDSGCGPGGDMTYWLSGAGMGDSASVKICKPGYTMNLAFLTSHDSSSISSMQLNFYANTYGVASVGAALYPYGSDNDAVQTAYSVPLNVVPGWNHVEITNLIRRMDGFGFTKFRLVASSRVPFSVMAAYYSVVPVGGGSNHAPVAVVNGPYEGMAGKPVSLSSQGTTDPDGDAIMVYAWNADGTFFDRTGPSPTIYFDLPGTYPISLYVADEHGFNSPVASTTAVIVPDNTVNLPPLVYAGPDRTVQVKVAANFDASSCYDLEFGWVPPVTWNFGDNKTSSTTVTTHAYAKTGTYTVTLTATSAAGLTASDTAVVNVISTPPTTAGVFGEVATTTPVRQNYWVRLSSATVTLTDSNGTVYTTTTDANGIYSFAAIAPGTFTVTASLAGYAPATQSSSVAAGQVIRLAFGLSAYGRIAGTVTDSQTSAPLASATVLLTDVSAGTFHAVTDPNGNYSIQGIHPGAYNGSVSLPGYTTKTYSGNIANGQVATLNFVLDRFGGVNGTVTDNVTASAIASANINITDATGKAFTAVTDNSGHFGIDNVNAGAFTGTVAKDGYVTRSISGSVIPGQAFSANVALAPKGTVTGTVTDNSTHLPVSFITVNLTDSAGGWCGATTNGAGVYRCSNIAPGPFSGTVQDPLYSPATLSGSVSPGGTTTVNVVLVPTAAIVTGTVTDSMTGLPVPGANVYRNDGGYLTLLSWTDPYGVYRLSFNPGAFALSFGADGYFLSGVYSGTATMGQSTVVNVTLNTASGYINGKVTDAATGLPVASAAISLYDDSNTYRYELSDQDGNYSIRYLVTAPGGQSTYNATVNKQGYLAKTISGTVRAGQVTPGDAALTPFRPAVSSITGNSAWVTWTTDQLSNSRVDYGTGQPYDNVVSNAAMVTSHAVKLTGLSPGTTYHFSVSTANAQGTVSTSVDNTFVTASAPLDLGDSGNVTIVEVTGSYDAKAPDGSVNDLPRRDVANAYFARHGDVDFLITLSTFDYAMPEAGAQGFYLEVKNDTQGINRPLFNYSSLFGSAGRLQGIIEGGNVTTLAASPFGPKLDETLTVLNHELMHRFGTYVRHKKPDGSLSTALLGQDSAHWSYLLDTKGSLMYGSGWRDNRDGTFTATARQSVFSPLDLYLMGMLPKAQVPPMLLIDNTAIDPTQLPVLGATVAGTAATITIDDIVLAEGERIPNAAASQKQFTVGFLLMARPGDNTVQAVQSVETVRKAFAGRFAELTQGQGSIAGVAPEIVLAVDAPADGSTIAGPYVTVSGAVINTTGAETAVLVNGIASTRSGCRVTASHVPLDNGANTLTVMATDNIALTSTATINVTALVGDYLRIVTNLESGLAPLTVSLNLESSFAIVNPTVAVSGPVTVSIVALDNTGRYSAEFPVEGIYMVTASAIGPDSQTYSDTVTIEVKSWQAMESLLRRKWDGMKQAIIGGNIDAAMTYFVPFTHDRYRSLANDPTVELATRLAEIERLDLRIMEGKMAEAAAIRTENAGKISYPVTFVLDDYGVWKILGF